MDFINRVEISGIISEIRTSERGTNFFMLKQLVTYNGEERSRLFEVLVGADRQDIIEKLALDKKVKFEGVLTIFRVKKYNIHKMIIEVSQMEILE
jgi:Mg2+/Co2+ transporter CorC